MILSLAIAATTAALGLGLAAVAHVMRHRPDEDSPSRPGAVGITPTSEVIRKQLAIMNGWAHTLEERWDVLDDADKRMAIGIIRRTSEEAVVRASDLATIEPSVKLSA